MCKASEAAILQTVKHEKKNQILGLGLGYRGPERLGLGLRLGLRPPLSL